MNPRLALRACATRLLLLSPLLTVPIHASAQVSDAGMPLLAQGARERLARAAGDTLLLPWQRAYMQQLTEGDPGPATDPVAAVPPQAPVERAVGTGDGEWRQLVMRPLDGHTAIYDPVRDRMVVFGGWNQSYEHYNEVWALSLAGQPAWTNLAPAGTAPGGRLGHSAIYDPVRDRMLVFGGYDGVNALGDLWALSLDGQSAWTQLIPAGAPPSARAGHRAIYDPVRDRMVVFGGTDATGPRNDVFALVLAGEMTWTALVPAGTPPGDAWESSAIYDPVRDRMVVFGHGLWSLSLADSAAWTELAPVGDSGVWLDSHTAIYDPAGDRMVVYGGLPYGGTMLYSLSLAGTPTWSLLLPTGGQPGGRYGHSAIYDPVRSRMVVFGGAGSWQYNDLWALSLAGDPEWASMMPQLSLPPERRHYHSAIYDPVRDRMVVFGGSPWDDFGPPEARRFNDTWALSLAGSPAWTMLVPTGTPPSEREAHSAIYDPVRDRMLVFGGDGGRNDLWSLLLAGTPAWSELVAAGAPPAAAYGHSAIYDPVRDRMLVFGGASGDNHVWSLSLAGDPTWTTLVADGTPPAAMFRHSAIYDPVRDRMLVYGGIVLGASYNDDVWSLSLAGTPTWSRLSPAGPPPTHRYAHGAIYDAVRDRMVIFGGFGGAWSAEQCRNDVWALDLANGPEWAELAPAALAVRSRMGHSALYDPARDRLIAFGGYDIAVHGYSEVFDNFCEVWALSFTNVLAVGDPVSRPLLSDLRTPAPNPAPGRTTLAYSVGSAGIVHLGVYDLLGRRVRRLVDGERRAGPQMVLWDGADDSGAKLGAGVYFVTLVCPGTRTTRRVTLLR